MDIDLFGLPIGPPRRGGPRAHRPDAVTRERVRRWRKEGATVEAIAADLGLSATSAARHYPDELGTSARPGRPRFHATEEQRALVAAMHAAGAPQPEIAAAIGVTVPTLVRHYPHEIGSTSKLARQNTPKGDDHGT